MKISYSAKYVIMISAAVALFAGCTNGGGSQLAPTGGAAAPNAAHQKMAGNHKVDLSLTLVTPRGVRPNLQREIKNAKQIEPNCCALQKTLIVTDSFGGSTFSGAVYAFDYNTAAALGALPAPPEGFFEPQGACSDNAGDFYIANTAASTIDEYSHSGTYIATISDEGQYPVGCSFDRSSGKLAVSNLIDTSEGPGSISIFSGGVLQNTYYPPNMSRVYFLGYEGGTGTLWLDGSDSSGVFQYDSFSGGSFTPVPITGGSIDFPGAVMWSGKVKSMVVGDQGTSTFYQVSDTGVITGSTVLQCTQQSNLCDIAQATIKGPGLVGPDVASEGAARFAFPAGGPPILTYPASYIEPIGSAVSPDKSG
ncbi:MAG: hypothetical protein WB615_07680 [Candidatus Tumulicola sp.]